jgi:hypothetical protein
MEKKFRNVEIGIWRKIGGIFPGGNTEWNLFAWGEKLPIFWDSNGFLVFLLIWMKII